MEIRLFFTFLALLILSTVHPALSFAQDSPQWKLPEGAKARKGFRHEHASYSNF